MGLDQPLCGSGLANPHGRRVVVVALALGFVFGAAGEGVDDVISRKGGVRREDAHLEVAEFIRLELAVFQVDQESIDGLDAVIHLDEISREEAPNRGEVAFRHGGPEMLLEVDDFDRSRRWVGSLRWGVCGECQKKKEGTHGTILASNGARKQRLALAPPSVRSRDYFVGAFVSAAAGVPTLRMEASTMA